MAFNPSAKVGAVRDTARKFGKPIAILIMADPVAGTLEYSSYGETKPFCAEAKQIGDLAYDAIYRHYEGAPPPSAPPAAWIAIEDRLPMPGAEVFTFRKEYPGTKNVCTYLGMEVWPFGTEARPTFIDPLNEWDETVTHWMPVPDGPE